ncbi:MAG: hypothetical protein KGL19_03050 [Bacteroidota bacterium]|nr:hypothetical protein [Bacteroidota bacterium]
MSCVLRILGENFDVVKFLKKSNLKASTIFLKEEPKFKTKPEGDKLKHSGLILVVSDADFDDLSLQIKDTIRFLKKNKKGLQLISKTKEIEYAIIDFGIDLKIDKKNKLIQNEFLSNELLKLSGELGFSIELSIYPKDLEKTLSKKTKK